MVTKLFCAALLVLLPLSTIAATAAAQHLETTTASIHTGMAMAADTLPIAKSHFHHVINCLVDRDSKAFDGHFDNPCDGMGRDGGALRDEAQTEAQKKDLQHALTVAQRGARSTTLEMAHVYAEWLAEILQRALT
ncbi:hypothetical protein ELE36_17830 [Pseudolysobacter antarcticus]|uniref:Uncharacterized protein n=1 Tax=Pseudolysobacter antarcticus TaxID=2511995 RepID=A0A411HNN8_9GAMM|nr:hypothetical protein [Pseudolysobacter antarcticus]QBB72076.1 hypothetical protein ELE36_17830 [Pseudolysobacter antarcticus]